MWWLEPHAKSRSLARLAMVLALAGLTAGCFQPLYGARTSDGSTVADQLRQVEVVPIRTPQGTAEASLVSELRNVLIFDLGGGGPAVAPTHKLTLQVVPLRQQVIVDVTTARPDVEQAGINATYSLTEISTGKVVVTGQTFSRVSYDNPGQEQRFARARGRRDAELRAAKVIQNYVLDHPYYRRPLILARGRLEALAERILARKQQISSGAADDHVRLSRFFFDPLEVAAAYELDAHGLEISTASTGNTNTRCLRSACLDARRRDERITRALVER